MQTPVSRTANDECGSANYDGIIYYDWFKGNQGK
jgi:hypothetical protein